MDAVAIDATVVAVAVEVVVRLVIKHGRCEGNKNLDMDIMDTLS